MATDYVCPICFDKFRKPKFIACGHTFCLPCLKTYLKESRNGDMIACPLCRTNNVVPADGLESLFDNYFVELREHDVIEFVPCGICEKSTEATNTCRHCMQIVCFQCKPSHRLAVELSGETFPEENNIDDNDEEEEWGEAEEVNDQASLPFHLMMSQAIKCQYNVILDFAFHVPYHSHLLASAETNITCLVPKDRDFVAVFTDSGQNILLLNRLGDTVDRIRLFESITCFVITKEDNILLASGSNRLIMRCTEEGCSKFANTGYFSPLSISLFVDGRFAVTGISAQEGKHTKRRDPGTFGVLQIFSRVGTLVKDVVRGQEGNLFEYPADVAVSPLNDTVAVADRKKRTVFLLTDECVLLSTYRGSSRPPYLFFMMDHDRDGNFIPLGLAFDSNGFLFLINAADGTIHVLQPNFDFYGYVLTREDEGFGRPCSIAISGDSRIWLGDYSDGKIRVYKISSFRNNFREF